MKTAYIFTNKEITKELGLKQIKESFSNRFLRCDLDRVLGMGKQFNSFEINVYTNYRMSDKDFEYCSDEKKTVPLNNPYCLDVEYYDFKDIKQIVRVLLDMYPEIWVWDTDYDWIGDANSFINSNHQLDKEYKGPNYRREE